MIFIVYLHPKRYKKMKLSAFVKQKRSTAGLTQPELSEKAGVGLRFVRELEQGKETLRLDKVNQVLYLFGYEMGPVKSVQPSTSHQSPDHEKG
jgi:y4mF family transcriptional regulator